MCMARQRIKGNAGKPAYVISVNGYQTKDVFHSRSRALSSYRRLQSVLSIGDELCLFKVGAEVGSEVELIKKTVAKKKGGAFICEANS